MRGACKHVLHMSKMIQIRNVPDDVHATIKSRAAVAGMSMSDYLKRDIVKQAKSPTWEEFDALVRSDPPVDISPEEIVAIIHAGRDRR